MLMVYVDDFKMSGPKASLAEGWKRIKRGLDIDDPVPVDRCLGCHHKQLKGEVNGKPVNVMQYVVEDFMEQCVQAYKDACQEPDMKLRPVGSPFIASPDGAGGDGPEPLAVGEEPGVLQPIASAVLMEVLYGARAARRDLLPAV